MKIEYIKKAVETDSGHDAECWVMTGVWLDVSANKGVITLTGYKDIDALVAKKSTLGTKQVVIEDLTQMDSYDAVRADVLGLVATDERFEGMTVEEKEVEVE